MTERGSDKHSPRVDDEFVQETESMERGAPVPSRAEEFREVEGAGDDEAPPDARLSGDRDLVTGADLSPDELEARSELARHLDPSIFPADRGTLLSSARENSAPTRVLDLLGQLPEGTVFENVQAVWTALGGRSEGGANRSEPEA